MTATNVLSWSDMTRMDSIISVAQTSTRMPRWRRRSRQSRFRFDRLMTSPKDDAREPIAISLSRSCRVLPLATADATERSVLEHLADLRLIVRIAPGLRMASKDAIEFSQCDGPALGATL